MTDTHLGAWDFSSKGLTAWYRVRGPSAFTVNTSVTISGLTTSKGMLNKRTKVMSAANPLIVWDLPANKRTKVLAQAI